MKRKGFAIWMLAGSLLAECDLNPQPHPPNEETYGGAVDGGASGRGSGADSSAPPSQKVEDASTGGIDTSATLLVDGAPLQVAEAAVTDAASDQTSLSADATADVEAAEAAPEAETDAPGVIEASGESEASDSEIGGEASETDGEAGPD
jgi:hypothetical protein